MSGNLAKQTKNKRAVPTVPDALCQIYICMELGRHMIKYNNLYLSHLDELSKSKGKLYVVGVGPGHHDHMTYRAKQAIEESEIIIGYDTYVSLVEDLIAGKEVYRYAMTQEVERANQAIHFAEKNKIVSLVSSGDPGIYGMIGLIYEILADKGWDREDGIYIECIPGISSLNSCAPFGWLSIND